MQNRDYFKLVNESKGFCETENWFTVVSPWNGLTMQQ